MRLFSLVYIAASRTVHVHYHFFMCIVSCHIYIYINTISLIFFSINVENVRGMLQSAVSSDQRIAIYILA